MIFIHNQIKKKSKILMFVLLGFLMWGCFSISTQAKSLNKQKEYNPIIKKHYPDYRLIDSKEIDHFAKEFFMEHYKSHPPTLVSADFDGNGLVDFAALLRSSNKKDAKTIFSIFLQVSSNTYKPSFNLVMDFYRTDVVIAPVQEGEKLKKTEALETHRDDVFLKYPAVKLIYVGKSAVVYFWNLQKDEFDTIWISD